jgi:hypothetical protein
MPSKYISKWSEGMACHGALGSTKLNFIELTVLEVNENEED